jgi:hypothetical protein
MEIGCAMDTDPTPQMSEAKSTPSNAAPVWMVPTYARLPIEQRRKNFNHRMQEFISRNATYEDLATTVQRFLHAPHELGHDLRGIYQTLNESLDGSDGSIWPAEAQRRALLDVCRRSLQRLTLVTQILASRSSLPFPPGDLQHIASVIEEILSPHRDDRYENEGTAMLHESDLFESGLAPLWRACEAMEAIAKLSQLPAVQGRDCEKSGKKGNKTGTVKLEDIEKVRKVVIQHQLNHQGQDPIQQAVGKQTRLGNSKITKIFHLLRQEGILKISGRVTRRP